MKRYIKLVVILLSGILIGWLMFHSSNNSTNKDKHNHSAEDNKNTIWTCSMHPQIQKHESGKCPLCGMDLIPMNQYEASINKDAVKLSKEAIQLANVITSKVSIQNADKEIRLFGKVLADERAVESQVSNISGRIEKLLVNFTGETVSKGQVLAVIYSPELITAQQELLEAAKDKQKYPDIYSAAKEKLQLLKLSDEQIASIEKVGKIKSEFEIRANTSGIVTFKRVNNGEYIKQGTVLYDVANLSKLWVVFDAYESDLMFLKTNDIINFTAQAITNKTFSGKINFIEPVINPNSRSAKLRVEINNADSKLKPEMFVTGFVKVNLNEYRNKLIIPRSAVLWTGKRSIVYVKQTSSDEYIFRLREVELGPVVGNGYIILSGLKEGEEIVTQGTFSIDAAAQLEGKPSMMNK